MNDQVYTVIGMTCQHCVRVVSTELGAVSGVESVVVELGTGLVTVTGSGYTAEQLRAAVDEAGYRLLETGR